MHIVYLKIVLANKVIFGCHIGKEGEKKTEKGKRKAYSLRNLETVNDNKLRKI